MRVLSVDFIATLFDFIKKPLPCPAAGGIFGRGRAGALSVPTGETKLTAAAVRGGWSAAMKGKKGEICTPSMYLGQFVGIGVVAAAREVVKGNVKEVS